MFVNAVLRKSITHGNSNNYRNKVNELVKTALKKNKRISIISSNTNIIRGSRFYNKHEYKYNKYAVYDTKINNMYDELTNEIVSDIETCACDYPESYISLVTTDTTDENDEFSVKSETYLMYCPE